MEKLLVDAAAAIGEPYITINTVGKVLELLILTRTHFKAC
jgi:hypothetical protein